MLKILVNIFRPIKIKIKILGSLITIIFSSNIMTWLNCCKLFSWFYWTDAKDIVFVWFHFLIYMNCFQLLFVLIILKVNGLDMFGVKIFNSLPVFYFFLKAFNFTPSTSFLWGNCIDNGDDSPGLNSFSEHIHFIGVLCLFFSI